jgi:hypothetical protein
LIRSNQLDQHSKRFHRCRSSSLRRSDSPGAFSLTGLGLSHRPPSGFCCVWSSSLGWSFAPCQQGPELLDRCTPSVEGVRFVESKPRRRDVLTHVIWWRSTHRVVLMAGPTLSCLRARVLSATVVGMLWMQCYLCSTRSPKSQTTHQPKRLGSHVESPVMWSATAWLVLVGAAGLATRCGVFRAKTSAR